MKDYKKYYIYTGIYNNDVKGRRKGDIECEIYYSKNINDDEEAAYQNAVRKYQKYYKTDKIPSKDEIIFSAIPIEKEELFF